MVNLIAGYYILVGVLMFGMWAYLLWSRQVPELADRPREIALHLVAEFSTAALLVASGAALLAAEGWPVVLSGVAVGMLLYTVVVSAGYYAQRNQGPMVAMFAALAGLTLAAVIMLLVISV